MTTMKSLWLDDVRPEPEGWVRAKTAPEAIEFLKTREFFTVSLDHDLGYCADCEKLDNPALQCEHVGNGYMVACWLEEAVVTDPTFPVPKVYVHTQNAAAMPRMVQAARKIEMIWQQRLSEDK